MKRYDPEYYTYSLSAMEADVKSIVGMMPEEIPYVRFCLSRGMIEGRDCWSSEGCGCLIGSLCHARSELPRTGFTPYGMTKKLQALDIPIVADAARPGEKFFQQIHKGDTILTSEYCQIADKWLAEVQDEIAKIKISQKQTAREVQYAQVTV